FQAEDGIRDLYVTGVQTCALPISPRPTIRASSLGKPRGTRSSRRETSGQPNGKPFVWPPRSSTRLRSRPRGPAPRPSPTVWLPRSEERRVGKECRARGQAYEDRRK